MRYLSILGAAVSLLSICPTTVAESEKALYSRQSPPQNSNTSPYPASDQYPPDNYTDEQLLVLAATYVNAEVALFAYGSNFTAADYANASYTPSIQGRLQQIGDHVKAQQVFLNASLGSAYPQPCQYIDYSTLLMGVEAFASFACGVEQFAASFYISLLQKANGEITKKVLGSMLSNAARHNAYIYADIFQGPPWTGPFDTPIPIEQALGVLLFVTRSCPSTNAPLPFQLPTELLLDGAPGYDGLFNMELFNVTISWATMNQTAGQNLYVNIVNGLGSITIPLASNNTIAIPPAAYGWSYLTLTTASDPSGVYPNNTIAASAFYHYDFPANVSNSGWIAPKNVSGVALP